MKHPSTPMSKLALSGSVVPTWLLVSVVCGAFIGAACQSSTTPGAETTTPGAVTSAAPAPEATAAAVTTAVEAATTAAAATAEPEKPSEATVQAGKKGAEPTEASPKPNAEAKPKPTEPPKDTIPEAPKEPPAEPAPAIEKPCLAQSFNFPAVKKACEKGGVPKAKALMKSWTNKGKEKGEEYKCATCHDNQRTYTNKSNADDDLRKLLAAIK